MGCHEPLRVKSFELYSALVGPQYLGFRRRSSRKGQPMCFGPGGGKGAGQPAVDVKLLHAKIGELTLPNAWGVGVDG
jgi:hypothetical protein